MWATHAACPGWLDNASSKPLRLDCTWPTCQAVIRNAVPPHHAASFAACQVFLIATKHRHPSRVDGMKYESTLSYFQASLAVAAVLLDHQR